MDGIERENMIIVRISQKYSSNENCLVYFLKMPPFFKKKKKKVILASWYRIYTKIMDLIGIQTKICWTVTRGEGLSPIESCEGKFLSVILSSYLL